MPRSKAKAYWEMNTQELREATKEFDLPIASAKIKPLTKAERAKFEKSRKVGVHSVFVSRRPITVTLELSEDLFLRSSQYAVRHHMTLAEVVERSLRGALIFAE